MSSHSDLYMKSLCAKAHTEACEKAAAGNWDGKNKHVSESQGQERYHNVSLKLQKSPKGEVFPQRCTQLFAGVKSLQSAILYLQNVPFLEHAAPFALQVFLNMAVFCRSEFFLYLQSSDFNFFKPNSFSRQVREEGRAAVYKHCPGRAAEVEQDFSRPKAVCCISVYSRMNDGPEHTHKTPWLRYSSTRGCSAANSPLFS